MISLWPHWQRPLFLVLLPALVYLLWKLWNLHEIKGSWQKLIPSSFQPWLLRGTSIQESAFPKLLITLASLLALLALLGPSWKHIEQPPLKIDAPLIIVMDLTPRMLSSDIPPNRLQTVKQKLLDIIQTRKDAQTALVAYSGSAHTVVPLSDDQATITNLINSISPNIMPQVGERADLGISKAIQLLNNTQQNNQINHAEILLITTGLSAQEQTAIKQILANKTFTLNILGVGTAQGAPILDNKGNFIKNTSGNIMLSKLDTHSLQRFAYSEGGYYSTITLNNTDINTLKLAHLNGQKRHTDNTENKKTALWQDQGYWLILPLLLLAALASRKGWLFCIPLIVILQPQPAQAFEWSKLWLNKDQQGAKLLKENNPTEAAKRFENKQWQGYSAYQAKDYKQAEQKLSQETTPEGIYNYGNTLARQGKYQEAINEWNKAIKAKPNFEQAIVNKKIVEDILKKQQQDQQTNDDQQQNQGNQQQNQGNQQQDKDNQQQGNQPQDSNNQPQNNQQQNQKNDRQNKDQSQAGNNTQNNQQQNTDQQEGDDKNSNPTDQDQQQPDGQPSDKEQQTQQNEQQNNNQQNAQGQTRSNADDKDINQQEKDDALLQQIRTIPDDPSELLRRKFYYEQRYNKGDY